MERKLASMILRRSTDAPPSPTEVDYCYQCQVEDVYAALQHALQSPSSGAFSALENYVDELRGDLRASVLALTRERIWTIVQALLTDAHGVILNVASYLTAKERVEHFEKTMANALDHEGRNMLADILVRSFEAGC